MALYTENLDNEIKQYIRKEVKEELIRNRCNKDDAERIVEMFISNPETREDIIDEWDLNTIRVCGVCGKPMHEGWLLNEFDSICSDECICKSQGWSAEDLKKLAEEESNDLYWTEWEG